MKKEYCTDKFRPLWKSLRIGIINDIRGAWKSCFIAMFFENIEEIARESVKQYIERLREK